MGWVVGIEGWVVAFDGWGVESEGWVVKTVGWYEGILGWYVRSDRWVVSGEGCAVGNFGRAVEIFGVAVRCEGGAVETLCQPERGEGCFYSRVQPRVRRLTGSFGGIQDDKAGGGAEFFTTDFADLHGWTHEAGLDWCVGFIRAHLVLPVVKFVSFGDGRGIAGVNLRFRPCGAGVGA